MTYEICGYVLEVDTAVASLVVTTCTSFDSKPQCDLCESMLPEAFYFRAWAR